MDFLFGKKYPIFNKEGKIEIAENSFLKTGHGLIKKIQIKVGKTIVG